MPSPNCPGVSWPSRVRRELIGRLYASDAMGVHDERLIDEVGYALLVRCIAITHVTDAFAHGRVHCPLCAGVFDHAHEELACPHCTWRTTWKAYHKTFRGKKLYGPVEIFKPFIEAFSRAKTPGDKMVAIDQMLHTFHHQLTRYPTAPAAKNVLEGNIQDIVDFLNTLSYGENSTPQILAMRETYARTLKRSAAGGMPQPQDFRAPHVDD